MGFYPKIEMPGHAESNPGDEKMPNPPYRPKNRIFGSNYTWLGWGANGWPGGPNDPKSVKNDPKIGFSKSAKECVPMAEQPIFGLWGAKKVPQTWYTGLLVMAYLAY